MKFSEKFTSWYICDSCAERHEEEDDARDCCAPRVEELFVCNICSVEIDSFNDAKNHLAENCKGTPEPTLHERYIEEVLMEGKPCLGEWSYEFAVSNDLEIV